MPVSCTSDGGPNLTAKVVEDMMKDFGIHHGISSEANPHANARAVLGVKTVKRMLRDNVSGRGTLDRANVPKALLQFRNTPDRDTRAVSGQGSLWKGAQGLLAKARVRPDGGYVDEPGRRQGEI